MADCVIAGLVKCRAELGVLREAAGPMTTADVVAAVMAAHGMDPGDRKAALRMSNQVGSALWRQERNGTVSSQRRVVAWEIAR